MRKTMTMALAAALIGTTAGAAQVITIIAPETHARMAMKREVVDFVQQKYGETAVYESADELPEPINDRIVPGRTLPEETGGPLPEALKGMPTLHENTRWVRAGNHLVEITPEREIVMTVYDVLG